MKLFHGTTLNRFLKALREGHLGTANTVWDASEPYTTYFYGEDYAKEIDYHDWFKAGIELALESACFGLAQERKNLRRVVLVFDSEDLERLESHDLGRFSPDFSCGEASEDFWSFKGMIPIELIKEIWIDKEDLDTLLLYFIGLTHVKVDKMNRNIFNVYNYADGLSSEVLEASVKVYETLRDWFFDNYNFESVEETSIQKLKRQFNIR